MASGFRSRRKSSEYTFVNGRAVRMDDPTGQGGKVVLAPGQDKGTLAPGAAAAGVAAAGTGSGASESAPTPSARAASSAKGRRPKGTVADSLHKMQEEDALELTPEARAGELPFAKTAGIMAEDRHNMHVKYLAFGAALLALALFSLCFSSTQVGTFHTPAEVVASIGGWFRLTYTQIFQSNLYIETYREVNASMPYYADCMLQVWLVFKNVACGALLALAGMLYQNTFRNPIAAPTMLGISGGINFAVLILVLQYGYAATQHLDLYYLYSVIGGISILLLVMLGGKWISGKGRFNVVNMILMGTIVSQLLGVVTTYAQAIFMDDAAWDAYDKLQNATGVTGPWAYGTLIIGGIVALIPVVLFRFKLNLISFSEDDARMLGVDPGKLRLVALGCGSLMVLVGQLNAGQVGMVSLIIPFVVRAVFGSEFRKQLGGNLLMGALVMLGCFVIGTFVQFDGYSIGSGQVMSILAIPLFVWMLAIQQKSWE